MFEEPSTFVQGVAVGLFIGVMVGIFLVCLMRMAHDDNDNDAGGYTPPPFG